VLGDDPECAEALIDEIGIDAFAVVGAHQLVPPAAERGHAEAAHAGFPRLQESGVGSSDPKLIRPRSRPAAAIAASAFVTSSGMIWVRSIPACAKFSRK
jgi:hypothetical protein